MPDILKSPLTIFLMVLAVLGSMSAVAAEVGDRPNFIVIYTDDQQYGGMGANNNDIVITPALDRLAEQGMRFTNARVVLPLCSPSRAALLTGRYGSANGVDELARGLNKGEVTFAQHLKRAGYRTGLTGKWHLGPKPTDPNNSPMTLGFDTAHYCWANGSYYKRKIHHDDGTTGNTGKQHIDEYAADRAIDFIRYAVLQTPKQPFILFHNTQTPHMNGRLIWDAKDKTKALYDAGQIPLPENWDDDLSNKPDYLKKVRGRTKAQNDYGYGDPENIQTHTRDYYAVITEMDHSLGRLFSEVENLGLMENTYIIFMGDNGWLMGDHGMTSKVFPYDASSKVPMFITGPDVPKQTQSHANALNIDIMPTLLSLAGIEIPEEVHGRDLSDLIRGHTDHVRGVAVLEILGGYGGNKPILAANDGRWSLIMTYEHRKDRTPVFVELYDLETDPWELNNIANQPEAHEARIRLEEAIETHRREILGESGGT